MRWRPLQNCLTYVVFIPCSFSRTYLGSTQVSPILDLVKDYFRFVITFFELISTSAQHIYHSALPLSPQTSIVREVYARYARPLARVVRGLPDSWGTVVATMHYGDLDDAYNTAVWSPCSRFIAVLKFSTIQVLDAVTLKRLNTIECNKEYGCRHLYFSPNSRFLMYFLNENPFSWDLQTGGLVCAIPPTVDDLTPAPPFSFAYSADGTTVALAYNRLGEDAVIATYDLLSKTHTYCNGVPEGCIASPIWAHGHHLRFATVKPGSIST